MCTLILAWRVFDDAPVVVAANRDEYRDRPSRPPGVYSEEPLVIAPRDAKAGGTWIGFNEHGLFAGITNRWNDVDLAGERSRGLLVADVLERESVREAVQTVERSTAENEYAGFNLVVADDSEAVWLGWDGELARTDFEPGVHVVVNVAVDDRVEIPASRTELGAEQAENARAVRDALAPEPDEGIEPWLDRTRSVLGDHEYGVCLHENGFGTTSSSLIVLGDDPGYAFADGPPCRSTYERVDVNVDLEGQF
ncbi:NRDE family protein [Natrialbaceae archaeon AArc-T1-2]|uniref:NRDE family protein n=1 Tax=Natrialbaceae archaeon AArc-T1-2 TaxID=3053904 RepID=UPI00255A93EC|nr:NRDE family protein [Natrialbaceae archaeon AArc-T1-2]WIV66593.1 NRDE family protein [Natrialbaceae archaeon AArc-T1-2]